MSELHREIIDVSHRLGLAHIPSALSMVNYLSVIKPIVMRRDVWIIGKPYGSQAYNIAFGDYKLDSFNRGVKTGNVIATKTVDYADCTFGDCLGVALGYAIANPKNRIWVNVSDSIFDVGRFFEACKYIGVNNINNIFMTIDCNNFSVNHKTDRIIELEAVLLALGWCVDLYSGRCETVKQPSNKPTAYIFETIKGDGFQCMIDDPKGWHYRTIDDKTYDGLINGCIV